MKEQLKCDSLQVFNTGTISHNKAYIKFIGKFFPNLVISVWCSFCNNYFNPDS